MTTMDASVPSLTDVLGAPPQAGDPQGLAPRGLAAAASGLITFDVTDRSIVWADGVERLYEQAKARQWNATTDIPWQLGKSVASGHEEALCTILTWMVQQEFAAWYIPSKFIPRISPSFIETVLFLSTQVVDEARHVEAITKRLFLNGVGFIGSYPGTESSLAGLINQDEYDKASFLLNVLGEGTFLDLFGFLRAIAPDEATRTLFIRAHEDEARHVAYGTARLRGQLLETPTAVGRFVDALEERISFATDVSGLPDDVQEALVVLAGGEDGALAYGRGIESARAFQDELHRNRVRRLVNSGFPETVATHLSDLHRKSAGNAM